MFAANSVAHEFAGGPAAALVRGVASADPTRRSAAALGSLAAAVTASGEWTRVLDLLLAHRLTPLAAIRLAAADHIPGDLRDNLERERRDAAFHALAAAAELTAALRALAAAGIPALPFKGPALALVAYGDVGARRMVDVDIVVEPANRRRALRALGDGGWTWNTGGAHTRDVLHRWLGHVPIERAGAAYGVELHWRFAPLALPWTLPVTDVLRRAQPVSSAPDASWLVPHPVDHLLLLAWHGTRHGWETLEWIASFAQVLALCSQDGAVEATETAWRVGGTRALGIAVSVARDALGVDVPEPFVSLVEHPAVRAESLRIVASLWLDTSARTADREARGRHAYWMNALDSATAKARFVTLTALQPTERELEMVRLPDALAALYDPLRLARVAARAILRRTA